MVSSIKIISLVYIKFFGYSFQDSAIGWQSWNFRWCCYKTVSTFNILHKKTNQTFGWCFVVVKKPSQPIVTALQYDVYKDWWLNVSPWTKRVTLYNSMFLDNCVTYSHHSCFCQSKYYRITECHISYRKVQTFWTMSSKMENCCFCKCCYRYVNNWWCFYFQIFTRERSEKETQRLAKETNSFLKQLVHLGGETPNEKVTYNNDAELQG